MRGARGVCKECGEEFFVDSENCGTDESLCDECFNWLRDMEAPSTHLESPGQESVRCF